MENTLPDIKNAILSVFALADARGVVALSCVSKEWVCALEIFRLQHGIKVISGVVKQFPDCIPHGRFTVTGYLPEKHHIVRGCKAWVPTEMEHINNLHDAESGGCDRHTFHYANGFLVYAYFVLYGDYSYDIERYVYIRGVDQMFLFAYSDPAEHVSITCVTDDAEWCDLSMYVRPATGEYGVYKYAGYTRREDTPFYPIINILKRIASAEDSLVPPDYD